MSADKLIDGAAIAADLLGELGTRIALLAERGVQPGLAVVLAGDDPASAVYVRNKVKRAEQVGIRSIAHRLPAEVTLDELLTLVERLNRDPMIHGVLVQLPLPAQIDAQRVIATIDPSKDVDGFHRDNVGGVTLGLPAMSPCTPSGCMHLLKHRLGDLAGLHAVVIGRSNIVGKPMATLLLQADCSVTVLHSRSRDAVSLCRLADIVVVAAGRPGLVDDRWLKPGAVVIDVGIHRVEDAEHAYLTGDVDFDAVLPKVAAITPVPGGVGPMTIAFLIHNTVTAAERLAAAGQG